MNKEHIDLLKLLTLADKQMDQLDMIMIKNRLSNAANIARKILKECNENT